MLAPVCFFFSGNVHKAQFFGSHLKMLAVAYAKILSLLIYTTSYMDIKTT